MSAGPAIAEPQSTSVQERARPVRPSFVHRQVRVGKILDRYMLRELLPPFLIGLGLFTLVLLMNVLLTLANLTIKANVSLWEVLQILFWSLPHIFALTIPMAVLLASNLGLGRMSADNEIIVLHASGVGLLRIGRALIMFSILCTVATGYILMRLVPEANRKARAQVYDVAKRQIHDNIHAKEFNEDFENYILYTAHIDPDTGVWSDVLLADTNSKTPSLTFAQKGRMLYSEINQFVVLELENGENFGINSATPESTSHSTFETQKIVFSLEHLIPKPTKQLGDREMTLKQLSAEIKRRQLMNPPLRWKPYAIEWHKKLSIPVACLVFAIIGLALGARNRSRGKSAGFVVSLAILLAYYVLLSSGERMGDQGQMPPWLAMWLPNILFGGIGLIMLVLAAREIELGIWDALATAAMKLVSVVSRLFAGRRRRIVVDTPLQHAEFGGGATPAGSFEAVAQRRRKTIVIRIPRPSPDFPRILDRYVIKEWVRAFLMILGAITAMYLIVDFSRIIDDINQNQVPWSTVIDYYKYSLPNILFLVLGPAALVTTLLVLGIMSRNNEIIVMKSSGISVYRIIMPVVLMAAILASVSFYVNDKVIPVANRKALKKRDEITKGPSRTHEYLGSRWMFGRDSRTLWNYTTYHPNQAQMEGVKLFQLDPDTFTLRRIVAGESARWVEGQGWDFHEGWQRGYGKDATSPFKTFGSEVVPSTEGPDYFVAERKAADELNFAELRDYIRGLEAAGFNARSLHVSLHWKLSFPFGAMVMTIIGIPFALRIGKRGNLFGVGVAIAITFVFWVTIAAFRPLGETGVFPVVLSAWAPMLIFGVAGTYMLLTLDT